MASDSDFNDLLAAAEQLTAEMDGQDELPRVQRNIRQVLETGQKLWSRTAQGGVPYMKASILLGSKGLDLPYLSQRLESLSTAHTFEPLEPQPDTDIQSFLKNERENAILSVVEETKKATNDYIDGLVLEGVQQEWGSQRQSILNSLVGLGEGLDLTAQPEPSVLSATWGRGLRSGLGSVESAYAGQVRLYNEAVVQGGVKPCLEVSFLETAKMLGNQSVVDLWELVCCLCSVPSIISSDPVQGRLNTTLNKNIIAQSKSYLESSYKKYLHSVVYSNLSSAHLGGIPGTLPLVRSFVQLRGLAALPGLQDGEVEGQPVWPMLFYCLRCGDADAAMQVTRKAGQPLNDLSAILDEFFQNNNCLSNSTATKVRVEYRRNVRNGTDVYKRAVYCMVGSCDPNEEHRDVATSTEDYLWVKLYQIQENDESESATSRQDRFRLAQLQTVLLEEYGESHFQGRAQPFLYTQVLLLSAQFEAAVAFLAEIESLRSHALHMALAFHERGLLLLPNSMQAALLMKDAADPPPLRRLNLARLLMLYTRQFEVSDPREALHYFYFLRSIRGPEGENLFGSCVSNLVLESGDFDLLLGRMEDDGCRAPGLIDQFQGVDVDIHHVVTWVAADFEAKGMFENAIKMYELSRNTVKVVDLLVQLLGQSISEVATPESTRDRVQRLAQSFVTRMGRQGSSSGGDVTTPVLHLLMDLAGYFDLFHNRKYTDAIAMLKTLQLVPFAQEEVEPLVATFRNLSAEVRRHIPDILLAAMTMLHSQYKTARGEGKPDVHMEQHLLGLRSEARALIVYAGMIPFRMPGDTSARLVQLEVLMS